MTKNKVARPTVSSHDTDVIARKLFRAMTRDFRSTLPNFRPKVLRTLDSDIKKFRDLVDDFEYGSTSVYRFKAHHQVGAFLKKYRFAKDVFTDEELISNSYKDFFEEQERISMQPQVTTRSYLVLQEARKLAHRLLGEFREEDIVPFCKFGTNSSIGCPLSLAHIDFKLSNERAFTGSAVVSKWFKNEVFDKDPILRRILRSVRNEFALRPGETTLATESLVLKDVPKTWKTLRIITPLPLLDLFYSNGIGGIVTERLSSHGLKISNLQGKHRKLVRPMSLDKRHITADLSKASDSITCQLLNKILPRSWYSALKPILKHSLEYGKQKCYTASVLPMGNGATFPVETLVFYCIIKAIGNLAGVNGIYSVYGDDLIYPSQLHRYVARVFPELGLLLNLDKTFVSSSFRESCGSDFYRGVDVRPFYLKGEHRRLTRSQYIVYLYKVYNGLRMRWEECELPSTFYLILSELSSCAETICRVPPSYPATAGIHTQAPDNVPLGLSLLQWSPLIKKFRGTRKFIFRYMSEKAPNRFVLHQEPYYWQTLCGVNDEADLWKGESNPLSSGSSRSVFRWVKIRSYRSHFRKKKRISVTIEVFRPCVSHKNTTNIHQDTGSVTDWT